MSWNGSNGASAPKQKPVNGARAVSKGAIAGVIVVLGAAAALYFFMPASTPKMIFDETVENPRPKIAEVDYQKTAPTVEVVDVQRSKAKTAAEKALERRRERNLRNGVRDFVPPVHTSVVHTVTIEQKLFSNRADQMLAILMTTEPGEDIFGEPEDYMGRNFKQELQNAVVSKIEFSPDDTEYERELKQMVIEAKQELFSRIRDGEDGCQVILDAYKELKNLGAYKDELKDCLEKAIRDESMSNEDVEFVLEAANKMLQERGISEMKMPGIYKARLKLGRVLRAKE